jgi:hypothetical protein
VLVMTKDAVSEDTSVLRAAIRQGMTASRIADDLRAGMAKV